MKKSAVAEEAAARNVEGHHRPGIQIGRYGEEAGGHGEGPWRQHGAERGEFRARERESGTDDEMGDGGRQCQPRR